MPREIRVRAKGDGAFLLHDGTATLLGRYCGRERGMVKPGGVVPPPLPDGEWVEDNAHYRRGCGDGSLELLEERS